jgi:hypothetical protein
LTGTASCSSSSMDSNIFRNAGSSPQLTQSQEVTTYAGSGSSPTLPSNYREASDINQDDEGFCNADAVSAGQCTIAGQAYVTTQVTSITWAQHETGFSNCGEPVSMASTPSLSSAKIADRITHCSNVNGTSATWNGSSNGNSGEGVWKLVTRNTPQGTCNGTVNHCRPVEVWQDQRTGVLWSSLVAGSSATTTGGGASSDNWCRADGNDQWTSSPSGTPWPTSDPVGTCYDNVHQSQAAPTSYCLEKATYGPTLSPALGTENWTTGVYDLAKGGMGAVATTSSPAVRWRLPTIHDYEIAEADGIRHVMPDMGAMSPGYEWSASVYSVSRASAWMFYGSLGLVDTIARANTEAVRCSGR